MTRHTIVGATLSAVTLAARVAMKRLPPVLLLLATVSPAVASPITYTYLTSAGGIPGIKFPPYLTNQATISGSITFDPALASADLLPGDPTSGLYLFSGTSVQFTALLNGDPEFPATTNYGPFYSNQLTVETHDGDSMTFRSGSMNGPPGSFLFGAVMTFDFASSNPSVLLGDGFPADPFDLKQWDQYRLVRLRFVSTAVNRNEYTVFGNVEEFGATPVPEPGTLILLGSGLVGLIRWRRSRVVSQKEL